MQVNVCRDNIAQHAVHKIKCTSSVHIENTGAFKVRITHLGPTCFNVYPSALPFSHHRLTGEVAVGERV